MITVQELTDYISFCQEKKELEERIARLENRIYKLKERLHTIEQGEIVKDRVYGGEGGIQGFNISGVPVAEYSKKKTELLQCMYSLSHQKILLEEMVSDLDEKEYRVLCFLKQVDDVEIRRLIRMRYIDKKNWNAIAAAMHSTPEACRMYLTRWLADAGVKNTHEMSKKRAKRKDYAI